MLALFKKELKLYFLTPTGWIFLAVFLFISGILFAIQNVFTQNPQYAPFLAGLIFMFLLMVPLLTMRIFTDERRFGTDQLLFTGPNSLWSIVFGKFLAAFTVFLITVCVTVLYPVFLSFHGRLQWSVIIGVYLGFVLLGASFIALGTCAAQAAEGAVGAAVLTFCGIIVTFVIDFLQPSMPSTEISGLIWAALLTVFPLIRLYRAGRNGAVTLAVTLVFALVYLALWFFARPLYAGLIGKSLSWVSLSSRFSSFPLGVLRLDAIVYYLSFTAFFLFLTVQGLEKRRWR